MKKIFAVLLTGMLIGNTYAQDDKTFHAGFRINPTFSWLKPDNKKAFENGGTTLQFGAGLITDFMLADKFWFSTGIGFDFDGGKIKYSNNPSDSIGYFYDLDDNEIVTFDSDDGNITEIDTNSNSGYIRLNERRFKTTYVTIPLIFKMKTKEIGMMKYYFQFGANLGIKTKGRADDDGNRLFLAGDPDLNDLNISSEMSFMRAQIIFGAGTECSRIGTFF